MCAPASSLHRGQCCMCNTTHVVLCCEPAPISSIDVSTMSSPACRDSTSYEWHEGSLTRGLQTTSMAALPLS